MDEVKHANEAKNRFLSQMSRDIRTPMNAILGMNQISKYEQDRESIMNCIASIEVSGKFL